MKTSEKNQETPGGPLGTSATPKKVPKGQKIVKIILKESEKIQNSFFGLLACLAAALGPLACLAASLGPLARLT